MPELLSVDTYNTLICFWCKQNARRDYELDIMFMWLFDGEDRVEGSAELE